MGTCCCKDDSSLPLLLDNDHRDNHAPVCDNYLDSSLNRLTSTRFKCIESTSCTSPGTVNGKTKSNNQDRSISLSAFGPHSCYQLFGVCDGHGPAGHDISQYFASKYPVILSGLLPSDPTSTHSIASILLTSFQMLQNALYEDKKENKIQFDIEYSGTTVNIGLIADGKIYVANVGDSRSVMGCSAPNRAVPQPMLLSQDHDASNKTEMQRIATFPNTKYIAMDGGRIEIIIPHGMHRSGNKYTVRKVNVSLTRSIGDRIAHQYGGLISKPEITIHEIDESDIFVIFASDGIWNVMSNDDVMRVVGCKLKANKDVQKYNNLDKITKRLVREAHLSWIDEFDDYIDDVTCVICRIGI